MAGRLTTVILTATLLPALLVGWVAFDIISGAIRQARIDDVGQVADIRHNQLTFALNGQRTRAELFLDSKLSQCNVAAWPLSASAEACLKASLTSFVHTEKALGGALFFPGMEAPLVAGSLVNVGRAPLALLPGQLAIFQPAEKQASRLYHVPVNWHRVQLVMTFSASSLRDIFLTPNILGVPGEIFLADAQGAFITKPRDYSEQWGDMAIPAVPMQTCLQQQSREMLGLDFRGAPIIYGFRYLPEIGGGCIMAYFDQQETFAPLDRMKSRAVILALLLGMLGVMVAIYLSRQLGRPLNAFSETLAHIEDGSENVTLSEHGPREITALALAFKRMLERLSYSAAKLRESEERSKLLLESVSNGIWGLDMEGKTTFVNPAAARMLGYMPEELIGKLMHVVVHYAYPDGKNYPKDGCPMHATLKDGKPRICLDEVLWHRDGSSLPVEYSAYPLVDNGTQVGAVVAFQDIAERKLAEQRAQQDQARLSGLIDSAMDAIISVDENQNITLFNRAAEQMFGYQPADLIGQPLERIIPTRYRGTHRQHVEDFGRISLTARTMDMHAVAYGLRANGEEFPFEASISVIEVAGKKIYTAIMRDITRRKQNEEASQLAALVYQASHEGVVVTDENNLIIDVNPAFTDLTGYTLDEVRGKNPRIFKSGKHDLSFYQQMWQSIQSDGHWQGEVWDYRRDGELHAKWLSISIIRHPDGSIFRHVAQFSDITEKKLKDELIWTQANFDALTNLPNRRLLADRINQMMSSGVRSGQHGALLLLDLDQFKRLNDTLGHSMGDKLLIEVASRMQRCVREEDTVARLGGDEFVVLLNELSGDQNEAAVQAEHIAEKIRIELCRPYRLGETEYHTSSSIGIVLFRGHSDSKEDLLAHVDAAMYQAKAKGRNTTCFFDISMQIALENRSQLESALRVALPHQELTLYYQLQVDNAGRPTGAEALLRWNHPHLGMVSPALFIPVAEETGLILTIGHWVLETACAQLVRWQAEPHLRHLCIAVNVSSRQFREKNFVARICETLKLSGIRPEMLKLELTESMVLNNVDDSIRKMEELKKLGVKFSLDDFGTGYSSLSYLSRLPVDQIKIDQSFVRDITTDPHDAAIVQTIIAMAENLGMEVIAEGVETEAQREFLELRGCRAYQGYLYAKPLPVAELEQKLSGLPRLS